MTRIISEEVGTSPTSSTPLSAVTQMLTEPTDFEEASHIFSHVGPDPKEQRAHRSGPAHRREAAGSPAVRPQPTTRTHLRLTECWLRSCDVHGGAAVDSEVLADTWAAVLGRLVRGEPK